MPTRCVCAGDSAFLAGPGDDVLRPMMIPVVGAILFADEIIDLLLPVLFIKFAVGPGSASMRVVRS